MNNYTKAAVTLVGASAVVGGGLAFCILALFNWLAH